MNMRNIFKASALTSIVVLSLATQVKAEPTFNPAPTVQISQASVPTTVEGFDLSSLIMENMRMAMAAKEAMKSSDPEVRQMAEQMYNTSMSNLHSLMTMWMKKSPFRTTSPR